MIEGKGSISLQKQPISAHLVAIVLDAEFGGVGTFSQITTMSREAGTRFPGVNSCQTGRGLMGRRELHVPSCLGL